VHFYLDGPPGAGRLLGAATARLERVDVGARSPHAGSAHGFDATLLRLEPGSTHRLWAYAINAHGAGENPFIGVLRVQIPPDAEPVTAPAPGPAAPADNAPAPAASPHGETAATARPRPSSSRQRRVSLRLRRECSRASLRVGGTGVTIRRATRSGGRCRLTLRIAAGQAGRRDLLVRRGKRTVRLRRAINLGRAS
jgi:hypothetical protein